MSYEERAQEYGIATKDQLQQVLRRGSDAVVLDVRSLQEIEASGKFQAADHKWVQAPVTPDSAEELVNSSEVVLPDKEAPVVVYCKSGRRASTAKQALEAMGYKNVLNAGGYDDIKTMELA